VRRKRDKRKNRFSTWTLWIIFETCPHLIYPSIRRTRPNAQNTIARCFVWNCRANDARKFWMLPQRFAKFTEPVSKANIKPLFLQRRNRQNKFFNWSSKIIAQMEERSCEARNFFTVYNRSSSKNIIAKIKRNFEDSKKFWRGLKVVFKSMLTIRSNEWS